ncbi:hypothetical protein PVAND_015309 [Polypedilum vanderplanki]|uniref:C2H2-type domain-containing protein n=1 Tax=Polypedilum vanderplanki TaxID=319348 RepID=A0A9J6BC87_POLVA|nr:hypothetical protein PVAND_015309 [Polypedilum vanderplanki]
MTTVEVNTFYIKIEPDEVNENETKTISANKEAKQIQTGNVPNKQTISTTIKNLQRTDSLEKLTAIAKESREKSPQQTFICSICNLFFDSKQKFSSHMKIHQQPSHQCPKCDRKFKSEKHLAKHECAICKICGHKNVSKSDLRMHMKQNHSEAANKIYTVQCDYCGKHIKTKTYLIHHIRAEHIRDEKTRLLCSICGVNFPNKFMLNQHVKISHSEMIGCKLCGKMVKPLCMPYHMKQVHASERNFLCTICSASFKTRDNLKDHMMTHNKNYVCHICNKRFSRRHQLNGHLALHNNPDAFSCQVCGHKYSTASYLKRHMKAHQESNVKCKICGIDVNVLSLHYHMKNSHPFDRFQCSKCGATGFGSQREFSEHLTLHEKERVEIEQQQQIEIELEKERMRLQREKEEEEERLKALAALEAKKIKTKKVDFKKKEKTQMKQVKIIVKKIKTKELEKENKIEIQEEVEEAEEAEEEEDEEPIVEFLDEYVNEDHFEDDYDFQHQNTTEFNEKSSEVKEETSTSIINESLQVQRPFDMFVCDIISKRGRKKKVEKNSIPKCIKVPSNVILICDMCGEEYDKKSKLLACIKKHIGVNDQQKCEICLKIFPNLVCLRQHLKSHDSTMIACEICGKRVKPLCMTSHIKQVHTAYKTLACSICEKVFKTKQNLRDHEKTHNKTFQCEVCGQHFSRGAQLNDHMLKHDSPELLDCPHCNLRLSDRRSLKKHIKNMHVERPDGTRAKQEKNFKCELCDYSCVQKGNLKIHYKKHEKYQAKLRANPDALKCEICEALFRSELILKIHMQKVHSDERFPCGHCENVLKTKSSLWSHLRKVHQIEPEKRKKKEKSEKVEGEKKKRRKRRKRNENGELVEREEIENNVKVIEIHSVADMEYY